jgi:hypothetical protein
MRNVSDKVVYKNQSTLLMFSKPPPPPEKRGLYKIMWKNIVELDRPQMKICRLRNTCWKTTTIDTKSEYDTLIAFPRYQWLRERSLMLLLYVHCLKCKCLIQGCCQLLKLCNVGDDEWMNEYGDLAIFSEEIQSACIKPRPNADLFTTNSTGTGLGSNSRLRCGRWAVTRLSYGSGRMRSHGSVAGKGDRLASSNGRAIS